MQISCNSCSPTYQHTTILRYKSRIKVHKPRSYCPNAPLTASAPAVAPAPKIAALPNFLPAFLSHSPCCFFFHTQYASSSAFPRDHIKKKYQTHMGMMRVGRIVGVFGVLSILLGHLRGLSFVGHAGGRWLCRYWWIVIGCFDIDLFPAELC